MLSIMSIIEKRYPSEETSKAEQEVANLAGLLAMVGGCERSILTRLNQMKADEFLGLCISNGITFKLTPEKAQRVMAKLGE
tara:strand:- start:18405 stop:18647 length:243 start_codon:yes stop_codon:yes gene_type:complete